MMMMMILCNATCKLAHTSVQLNRNTHLYEGVEDIGKRLVTIDEGTRDGIELVTIVAILLMLTDAIQNGYGL